MDDSFDNGIRIDTELVAPRWPGDPDQASASDSVPSAICRPAHDSTEVRRRHLIVVATETLAAGCRREIIFQPSFERPTRPGVSSVTAIPTSIGATPVA